MVLAQDGIQGDVSLRYRFDACKSRYYLENKSHLANVFWIFDEISGEHSLMAAQVLQRTGGCDKVLLEEHVQVP